jgi:hypothetical protein
VERHGTSDKHGIGKISYLLHSAYVTSTTYTILLFFALVGERLHAVCADDDRGGRTDQSLLFGRKQKLWRLRCQDEGLVEAFSSMDRTCDAPLRISWLEISDVSTHEDQ